MLPLGIRQRRDRLIIPMRKIDGTLLNVQQIYESGNKQFPKGGRTKGLFLEIEGEDPVCICEGVAKGLCRRTVLSLYVDADIDIGLS